MALPILELLQDIQDAALISAQEHSIMEQLRLNEELGIAIGRKEPLAPVLGPELFVLPKMQPRRQTQTKIDKLYGV